MPHFLVIGYIQGHEDQLESASLEVANAGEADRIFRENCATLLRDPTNTDLIEVAFIAKSASPISLVTLD